MNDDAPYAGLFRLPVEGLAHFDDPASGQGDDAWSVDALTRKLEADGRRVRKPLQVGFLDADDADDTVFIFNGNHRLAAARRLGIGYVPCEAAEIDAALPLTPADIRRCGGVLGAGFGVDPADFAGPDDPDGFREIQYGPRFASSAPLLCVVRPDALGDGADASAGGRLETLLHDWDGDVCLVLGRGPTALPERGRLKKAVDRAAAAGATVLSIDGSDASVGRAAKAIVDRYMDRPADAVVRVVEAPAGASDAAPAGFSPALERRGVGAVVSVSESVFGCTDPASPGEETSYGPPRP